MPNRTSIIIGILVLVAIVGGVLLFGSGSKVTAPVVTEPTGTTQALVREPSNPQQPAVSASLSIGEAVITATDAGFSPSTLTVKRGTTVTFKNNSSMNVWPAANPHPIHTSYPEGGGCVGSAFDACRGLAPGESWSFTFNDVGTWGYHDHLHSRDKGTVIVQ